MNANPANDRADFHLLQQGDDAALDRLIARWEQPLFAYAWRYLHNDADARDLAIEVFVRLHQQRLRLRPDTNLSAWLFTTLTNLCHNRHRWHRRHPTVSLDDVEGTAVAEGVRADPRAESDGPGAGLERDEVLGALDAAIARLPRDLKTAVLLHHHEGLSYREIADICGCSERGVETRLYRARRFLREELVSVLHEPPVGLAFNRFSPPSG